MATADNTPDFDSMSPEEINRWLESLAKRQGVSDEELTTAADMEIAEIDPNAVVIDEPGYVPYGEERPPRVELPRPTFPPPAPPPADEPPRRPTFPPPAAPQVSEPPPSVPPPPAWRSMPPPQPEPTRPVAAALDDDSMSWLESLAADQSDSLFNLDLSALTGETASSDAGQTEATDPMAWLKSLADEATAPEPPEPPAAVSDPFASGVDPMAWLENLARRQGARDEELTTATEMHIPVPENPVIDEPGYTPFSFDSPIETRRATMPQPEPLSLENPSDWLGSLADSQGFDESQILSEAPAEAASETSYELADIEQAIADGTVTPEQMQVFLERETDAYVESLADDDLSDEDDMPVPADLPDWLLEQVGPPPPQDESERLSYLPPLTEVISEPSTPLDLPDWLQEDVLGDDELDFDSIFANRADTELVAPDTGDYGGLTLDINPDDPWVEAFDAEQDGLFDNLEAPPDWYTRNLHDPQRIAAIERQTGPLSLRAADLPEETELPVGQPISLPEWLSVPAAEATPGQEAVPDWLAEPEAPEPGGIPEWLVESMDAPEPAPPEPEPQFESAPVPIARRADAEPESAALETARERARAGALTEALEEYDVLVRASRELDSVVSDLQSLVRQHRTNPAVFRVLGDGLMRQGRLQAALDTYREALSLL